MTAHVPRPLSDAEVKQLQSLQALFDPAASLKRVDDFSKWIFASVGVIGTLGAAFSNSALSGLAACGKVVFGVAVLLTGMSFCRNSCDRTDLGARQSLQSGGDVGGH